MSDSESRKDGEMDEACSRNGTTPKNVPVRLWEVSFSSILTEIR